MRGLFSNIRSNVLKVVISYWIFIQHTNIKSIHEFFILFRRMFTSTIVSHHISNFSSFSYSKMFYMAIAFFISSLHLSNDR